MVTSTKPNARRGWQSFQRLEKGILIATDCISEGINLQHMANQMIHYELPWNPNRLEQRNGRIDRYGQKEKVVHIKTLVMSDTLDATILKVLVSKGQEHPRGIWLLSAILWR